MHRATRLASVGAIAIGALALASCSGSGALAEGSIGENYDLSDVSITVGSDNYTEQLVLGQLTILALEAAGADVGDQTGLAGTQAVRTAITSGEVNAVWDYTGTAWMGFLGHSDPIPDSQEQYDAVKKEDAEKNDLVWGAPTPANNTYQLVYSSENYPDVSFTTISDVADAVNSGEQVTICVGSEFVVREDGLPGMEKHYGFEFPEADVTTLEDGLIYNEVAEGDSCQIGVAFATDGRIQALNLSAIEDDQAFFPAYNAAFVARGDLVEQAPEVVDLFDEIAEKLTNEELAGMNAQVDVDGDNPDNAAEDWLRANGFIG